MLTLKRRFWNTFVVLVTMSLLGIFVRLWQTGQMRAFFTLGVAVGLCSVIYIVLRVRNWKALP
jgi:hypothetical protein